MALRGHFSCLTGRWSGQCDGMAALHVHRNQQGQTHKNNPPARPMGSCAGCRPSPVVQVSPQLKGPKIVARRVAKVHRPSTSTRCFGVANIPAMARPDDYIEPVQKTAGGCGEPENHCQVVASRTPRLMISANGEACAVHRAPKGHRVHGADGPAASNSPGRQNAQ